MTTTELPRWDVTPFFTSLDDPELAGAHERLVAEVTRLVGLYDEHDVRGGEPVELDGAAVASFEAVVAETNRVREDMRPVFAYVHSHVTTDARDDKATSLLSRLQTGTVALGPLGSRFEAWVARLGAEALVTASTVAADHAYPLRKAEAAALHQMSEDEEGLAAEMNLTGATAWARLHGEVTGRLTGTVTFPDGRAEELPVTMIRNLAGDADPAVRVAAHEAEIAAWVSVEVPLAAAMNGVKGQANALNRRRGWADGLEPALFSNGVDRATLDAMQSAVIASLPSFGLYLQTKAKVLGYEGGLKWWDLLAPIGDASVNEVGWTDAKDQVHAAFATYSPSLAGLAQRAFDESWVDAGPRAGKQGGAYCMGVTGGISRVFMNFAGTPDSVSTLAHELGHAYHNVQLGERTPLQRNTPMALAETASIFCETILVEAGLAIAGDGEEGRARRLVLLDTDLTGSTQVVVDIHSRFLFEQAVFEQRAGRTLSAGDLCSMMGEAQAAAYGDGLDLSTAHPYMWAVKGHYYGTSFYNWPYTFGLLFGLGLYARFQMDPDAFRGGYDDLLSSTGLDSAADLAARFGIDIRDEAFWAASLAVIGERIDTFCALAR